MKATIFAPSFVAGTSEKYEERLPLLVSAVAASMPISETDINIQLYDATLEDNYMDEDQTVKNLDTASGKVMLTYNNDIFKDGSMAAYQVWGGAQVNGVRQANRAINTAMMEVSLVLFVYSLPPPIFNHRNETACL